MILIGQYDSPFVRRVAIALKTYGLSYQHKPWSVFGDADKISKFNPLRRVPTLVTPDHTVFTDSTAILGVVDGMAGTGRASLARGGDDARDLARITALAAGAAEKGVSLVYERMLRDQAFQMWVERCRLQILETLDLLEAERQLRPTRWLFDDELSHADVMLTVMWSFISQALADDFEWGRWPAIKAHAGACEALAVFAEANQPFKLATPQDR